MTDGIGSDPRTLGGRYQLGDLLGRGGMAEVHIGRDTRLGRTVAIKLLRTDLARDPSFQARFRREAQSAASLNHPNIVAVYDTGEEPMPDGSGVAPYIVMEYVQGETLREVLRSGRRLLPERSLEIAEGILAALDYSHRHGIIHRDVKPGNVMLTPSGQVKVMDFGIARAIADSAATMTQTSAVLGTAQYLSPEQARGETVDARSDVYSAGCLLYELLTGRPPFTGDSPVSVAYQHVREFAVPPSQLDAEIPASYDAVVMKSLAKDPAQRYQTAAEMAADLERARTGRPIIASAVGGGGVATMGTTTAAIPGMGSDATQQLTPIIATTPILLEERPPPRRTGWYVLLGIATIAVLAGAAWLAAGFFGNGSGTNVRVPDLTGLTQAAAQSALVKQGLTLDPQITNAVSDKPKGTVIDQDPAPQAEARKNAAVSITLSGGPSNVAVPVVVGLTQPQAEQALQTAGLGLGTVTMVDDRQENKGTVIDSNPSTGTSVAPGTKVALSVASGLVKIPDDLVGQDVEAAITELQDAGFNYRRVPQVDGSVPGGQVLDTNPEGGTELEKGKTVAIVYAKAPPSSSTPPPSSSTPPPSSSSPTVSPSDDGGSPPASKSP
jgi:eukaryotic-like serine/threonine-protein kinase